MFIGKTFEIIMRNSGSYLTLICMINLLITFHMLGEWQTQLPSVEVVPDNNVSFSANTLNQTMDHPLHWRHVSTLPCYLSILCLRHNTPYLWWHVLCILPFHKQGLIATHFGRKQTRLSRMLLSTSANALSWRHCNTLVLAGHKTV